MVGQVNLGASQGAALSEGAENPLWQQAAKTETGKNEAAGSASATAAAFTAAQEQAAPSQSGDKPDSQSPKVTAPRSYHATLDHPARLSADQARLAGYLEKYAPDIAKAVRAGMDERIYLETADRAGLGEEFTEEAKAALLKLPKKEIAKKLRELNARYVAAFAPPLPKDLEPSFKKLQAALDSPPQPLPSNDTSEGEKAGENNEKSILASFFKPKNINGPRIIEALKSAKQGADTLEQKKNEAFIEAGESIRAAAQDPNAAAKGLVQGVGDFAIDTIVVMPRLPWKGMIATRNHLVVKSGGEASDLGEAKWDETVAGMRRGVSPGETYEMTKDPQAWVMAQIDKAGDLPAEERARLEQRLQARLKAAGAGHFTGYYAVPVIAEPARAFISEEAAVALGI